MTHHDKPRRSPPELECDKCGAVWKSSMSRDVIAKEGRCLRCGAPITLPRPNDRKRDDR